MGMSLFTKYTDSDLLRYGTDAAPVPILAWQADLVKRLEERIFELAPKATR